MSKSVITASDQPVLTVREIEVALGISNGRSYPEISQALGLGLETVRSYVNKLRSKTGRRRKAELAIWAAQEKSWLWACKLRMQVPQTIEE